MNVILFPEQGVEISTFPSSQTLIYFQSLSGNRIILKVQLGKFSLNLDILYSRYIILQGIPIIIITPPPLPHGCCLPAASLSSSFNTLLPLPFITFKMVIFLGDLFMRLFCFLYFSICYFLFYCYISVAAVQQTLQLYFKIFEWFHYNLINPAMSLFL